MESMSSPVTTFLYVLMRDHLPTGTVKYLIDQAQRAGSPAYSAPELEQLAGRYAEALLNAEPRDIEEDREDEELPSAPPPFPASAPRSDPPEATAAADEELQAELDAERRPASNGNGGSKPPESDVELMARVSDYIEQADGRGDAVWPSELDRHFAISPERRRKVIDMLVERKRVVIRKPNSPHAHYTWRTTADPDYSLDDGSTGKLHLRDKQEDKPEIRYDGRGRVMLDEQLVADFKKWAIGQRTFKRRTVIEAFEVGASTAGRLCNRLVQDGVLELRGERGGAHYVVCDEHLKTPVPKLGRNGKSSMAVGEGTAEGRVMATLQGGSGMTVGELSSATRMTPEELRPILGKLYKELMCRPVRDAGETRYALV